MSRFRIAATSLIAATAVLASVATSAAGAGTVPAASSASKVKVGLAIIAPIDDKGFNALADRGLKIAKSRLGVKGTATVTALGGDYLGTLNTFISQHFNFIVAVGALWDNAVYQVAKTHPHLHFAMVDGFPVDNSNHPAPLSNVASLLFRSEQPGFIVGVLAGLMEKKKVGVAVHNSIGVLGAVPLPFINAQMCGYYEGAKAVDKTIKLVSAYAESFGDPQKGMQIGNEQISTNNADILFGVADASGLGYYQAAKANGRYAIGFAADQDDLGTQMLTSAEVNIHTAVFRIIRSQVEGKFRGGDHYFSLKNGGVGYATDHMHHVPGAIKNAVATMARKVASGKVKVSPTCQLPS
jgi:basic membrane protein A